MQHVPLHSGLVMEEPENLPASTAIFGNDPSMSWIDDTIPDLDARKLAMNDHSNNGMHFPDPFSPRTTSSSISNPSDAVNHNMSEGLTIYSTPSTDSPSPKAKPAQLRSAAAHERLDQPLLRLPYRWPTLAPGSSVGPGPTARLRLLVRTIQGRYVSAK